MRAANGVWIAIWGMSGCGGDARVELSAGDALTSVAAQMERAVQEYHQEVSVYDDTRESNVVSAFITRVRQDAADEAVVDAHAAAFAQALARIRGDRETEWTRRTAAMENVSVLREIAHSLQKLAIQSLGLEDEWKRYLTGWIEAKQRKDVSGSAIQNPAGLVGKN